MHNAKLIFACLATAFLAVRGQDIDDSDIPQECRSICSPVVQLSQRCQQQYGDDDQNQDNNNNSNNQGFRDCICNDQGARTNIPTCDACIVQYRNNNGNGNGDDDDNGQNDVDQWLRTCNFPTTTISSGFTTSPTSYYGSQTYGGQSSCQTATFTSVYNSNDNDDDQNDLTTSTSTSVFCGNNGYSTGGYYSTPTSWSTTTFTSTYNDGNGNQQTITSTALVGTETNGNVVTTPTDATSYYSTPYNTFTSYTGGVGPIATALPYAGAGAGFLMLAFAI